MSGVISKIVSSIVAVLLVVALVVGIGAFAYQAGVQQGAALVAKAGDGATVAPIVPYPYYGYGRFHAPLGFMFAPLGCLIPLFGFFLFFGLMRFIFRPWGWEHHHGWRGHWMKEGVPPMFEEWHKKMHGEKPDDPQK